MVGVAGQRGRLAAFLIGIYDRLRRADLIARPTFNLHLTQDQVGDYLGLTMVHVSRTLKRMREERLAIVDRGVVIIHDVERLRAVAATELPAIATDLDMESRTTPRVPPVRLPTL